MRVLNGPFHNCSTSRYVIIKSKALIIHLLNSHLINLSNYIYLGNYNVICSLCFTMNSMINYIMSKNEIFNCTPIFKVVNFTPHVGNWLGERSVNHHLTIQTLLN